MRSIKQSSVTQYGNYAAALPVICATMSNTTAPQPPPHHHHLPTSNSRLAIRRLTRHRAKRRDKQRPEAPWWHGSQKAQRVSSGSMKGSGGRSRTCFHGDATSAPPSPPPPPHTQQCMQRFLEAKRLSPQALQCYFSSLSIFIPLFLVVNVCVFNCCTSDELSRACVAFPSHSPPVSAFCISWLEWPFFAFSWLCVW